MGLGYEYEPNFNARLKADAERRMQNVDNLPAPLRAVVKEFGYHAVNAFLSYQITDPKTIRILICAARGITPDRGHVVRENHRPHSIAKFVRRQLKKGTQ